MTSYRTHKTQNLIYEEDLRPKTWSKGKKNTGLVKQSNNCNLGSSDVS